MSDNDMTELLPEFISFAEELANVARAVIVPLFRTTVAVDSKQDESPVTVADRNAEIAMRELIMQRYPQHGIWGEELGRHHAESDYCWVLDPVDGTKSFISGFPTFGTLISLTWKGLPVLGVIDQPINNERWIGTSQGTTLNARPCTTRPCAEPVLATFSTTSPYLFGDYQRCFEALRETMRYTVFGYDCYAYAQLASGFVDAVVEVDLKPHDYCALRPVIEGAGGMMTDWHGAPLSLDSDGRVIATGDKRLHARILEILHQSL